MQLEKYISELILRHNCLIIPGFGGFVARYAPAKIDWSKGIIAPPSKEVLFNTHLIQSDGLFVGYVAQREAMEFDQAANEIATRVISWKETLRSGGRVEIEQVGLLFQNQDGQIQFEQDRFFNLLLDAYGMKEVTFVAEKVAQVETKVLPQQVLQEAELAPIVHLEPELEVETQSTPIVALQPQSRGGFNWKYLAAAALIPFGFYVYWIPMKTDVLHSGKVAFADFNPFRAIPGAQYDRVVIQEGSAEEELHYSWEELTRDLPKEIEVFNYRFDEDLYIPVRLEKPVQEQIEEAQVTPKVTLQASSGNYHLIAGCFGNKDNADKLVAELQSKGLGARIIDERNGLHRVAAVSVSSSEEASQTGKQLAQQGIETWLLVK
jgi:hypothetical protein